MDVKFQHLELWKQSISILEENIPRTQAVNRYFVVEVHTCPRSIPRHLFCSVTHTIIQTAVLTVPLLLCNSSILSITEFISGQENSAKSLLLPLYLSIYNLSVNSAWNKPGRIKVCCYQWPTSVGQAFQRGNPKYLMVPSNRKSFSTTHGGAELRSQTSSTLSWNGAWNNNPEWTFHHKVRNQTKSAWFMEIKMKVG